MHFKAVLGKQPLVDFRLPFVPVLPFRVQVHFAAFGRRLVVHDHKLASSVDPQVINPAADDQVGRSVQERRPAVKRIAPLVHPRIVIRNGFHSIRFHERMAGVFGAVQVEFLLEKPVNGGVERKRVARRLRDTASAIQVEALRALEEEVDLGAADFKRLG